MSVTAALAQVTAEMPGIGKDSTAAAQQGGYAYRGIEAITREVQPLFAKHGIVIAPHVHSFEVEHIEVNGKPWTDTRLLVSYTVYGPGGLDDRIEAGPILAVGRDNSDKGANKCMTQAFKYLLLQLLCVSDAKDDGDSASVVADRRTAPPKPLTADEQKIHLLRTRMDALPDELQQRCKAEFRERWGHPNRLPADQFDDAMGMVRRYEGEVAEQAEMRLQAQGLLEKSTVET